jgi:hypothetical protein
MSYARPQDLSRRVALWLGITWSSIVPAAEKLASDSATAGKCCTSCRVGTGSASQSYWRTIETENFEIIYPHDFDAAPVAEECERWRAELMSFWLGAGADEAWPARCSVVLHPGAGTYVQAAGRGSEQTYGCSTVKQSDGKIASRRIDVRLDRDDPIRRVLPHELTHVVLAEIISHAKTPRWADEGMALLADLPAKQAGHERDLATGLEENSAYRLVSFLTTSDYPGPNPQLFYGESLSLTRYLVSRDSPEKFVAFIEDAASAGYDAALRDDYDIHDVSELEKLWLRSVRQPQSAGKVSAVIR